MGTTTKRLVARVALGLALSAGLVGFASAQAQAGGTSSKTNGCYGEWWNTAFAGYCEPVSVSGQFELVGICNEQGDYYGNWRYMSKGSYVEPFDNSSCRFSVSRAYVQYSNG